MLNLNKIDIPRNPAHAIKLLSDYGFEAGIVGGCTRDSILGKSPNDWDICTCAKPDEIKMVFKDFKQIETGLKHGTISIVIEDEVIEITTYRIDGIYSDGRRPENVIFTNDLIKDLSRRDFTQNAIFYNDFLGFVDPFGGIKDLEKKILKCVGNPDERLKEDSLRILRGIRFASSLNFKIDKNTKNAMIKHKKLLKNISCERISCEFLKTIQNKNSHLFLDEFKDIFAIIIPEFEYIFNLKQNNPYHIYDVWKHSIISMQYVDNIVLKLVMLFHDLGKAHCHSIDSNGISHFYNHSDASVELCKKIFKRLKINSGKIINKNDINNIFTLIKYHDFPIEANEKSIKKLILKLNSDINQFKRLILVKKADALAQSPEKLESTLIKLNNIEKILDMIISKNDCLSLKNLLINGDDLLNLNFKPGKHIGFVLNKLLIDVIENNLNNNKKELIDAAKKYL